MPGWIAASSMPRLNYRDQYCCLPPTIRRIKPRFAWLPHQKIKPRTMICNLSSTSVFTKYQGSKLCALSEDNYLLHLGNSNVLQTVLWKLNIPYSQCGKSENIMNLCLLFLLPQTCLLPLHCVYLPQEHYSNQLIFIGNGEHYFPFLTHNRIQERWDKGFYFTSPYCLLFLPVS